MRSMLFPAWVLAFLAMGCAAHRNDLDYPAREAIYDHSLEEMWPEVRAFFTRNNLPFQEGQDGLSLETEWRQEFGASKAAGFFHRYWVVGQRESASQGKLHIFRITQGADQTPPPPGSGGGFASAPGQRDMLMEWRVFREVAPRLAKEAAAPAAQVARLEESQATPTPISVECGLPIIGLGSQVKPGATMLLGEMHGTREVPRFVAQLACQSAVAGIPVTVGLELPLENQERVDTFLDSAGTEEDWLKLMEAPFWHSPYPDGRSSEAVARLLEQVRQLRSGGLDVDVFVFDHLKASGQQREDAMAATVALQVEASPRRFHVLLTGNIHSRARKGLPWDEGFRPMGLLLEERLRRVVSLDMAYDSGTAWICSVDSKGVQDRLDCGVKRAKGKDNGDRFFVHTWDGVNAEGYHGVFYVGRVSASAPVARAGAERPGEDGKSSAQEGQGAVSE